MSHLASQQFYSRRPSLVRVSAAVISTASSDARSSAAAAQGGVEALYGNVNHRLDSALYDLHCPHRTSLSFGPITAQFPRIVD